MGRRGKRHISSHTGRQSRILLRLYLAGPAIACSAVTAYALIFINQRAITETLNAAAWQHQELGLTQTLAVAITLSAPFAIAVIVAFASWQSVRLLHLAAYLIQLHQHCSRRDARRPTFWNARLAPRGLPFERDGTAHAQSERSLRALLDQPHSLLLLGEHGSGKSTALRHYAWDRTRLRHLIPIALGRAPLPILVHLGAYAAAASEPGGPRLRYLAAQIRSFGHLWLAERMTRTLTRWNVVFLCDDLDEVPAPERSTISEELHHLAQNSQGRVRVVVTCELSTYLASCQGISALNTFERVVIVACEEQAALSQVRHAWKDHQTRRRGTRSAGIAALKWQLGTYLTQPATLGAVFALLRARRQVPSGRACLAIAHLNLLSEPSGRADISSQTVLSVLGRLACSMLARDESRVPVPPDGMPGQALSTWIASNHPTSPGEVLGSGADDLTEEQIEAAVRTALRSGILDWEPDGLAIRFAQHRLAATCAGLGLYAAASPSDDSALRWSSGLLHARWSEPLLVWSTYGGGSSSLIVQLLTLADVPQPDHSARRALNTLARSSRRLAEAAPTPAYILALALALALERLAQCDLGGISDSPGGAPANQSHADRRDLEILRTVFERIHPLMSSASEREVLGQALMSVQQQVSIDIAHHLHCAAHEGLISRIVRAQAIGVLGLLPGENAALALVGFLAETDPVLRQAVDTAFSYTGPAALARVQTILQSEGPAVRARALHVLSLAGDRAITIALHDLHSHHAHVRASAARLLGELSARSAVPELLAHLDDANQTVRGDIIWALGQTGDPGAVTALEERLHGAEETTRGAIARALGALRQAQSVPALTHLLQADSNASVRVAAAEALGKIGDERAIQPLLERLTDPNPLARAAAASALRRIGYHFGADTKGIKSEQGLAHSSPTGMA